MIENISVGTCMKLRKAHACGENRWEVLKAGEEMKIRCLHCGHILYMGREKLQRSLKQILNQTGA